MYVNKDSWNSKSTLKHGYAVMHPKKTVTPNLQGFYYDPFLFLDIQPLRPRFLQISPGGRPNPFRNILVGEM